MLGEPGVRQSWSDVVRRASESGHLIGNHSWAHGNYPSMTPEEMRADLIRTNDAIADACGKRPKYFRPPEGASNDEVLRVLGELGMKTVDWTLDAGDYELPPTQVIAQRVMEGVLASRERDHIVLLHDGGGDRRSTIEALDFFLPRLRSAGCQFVTADVIVGER